MEATELMIGDIINANGNIGKIISNSQDYVEIKTIEGECIKERVDNINPIALSSKFFEKNNFIKINNHKWKKKEEGYFPFEIIVEDTFFYYEIEIKTYDSAIQNKIFYINEFQHNLKLTKLCTLIEFADNLIVKGK